MAGLGIAGQKIPTTATAGLKTSGPGNLTPQQQLQLAFANQSESAPLGFSTLFQTQRPLKPSFSITPPKQARRKTALNQRIEALLGRFDDFAQGQGQGLDTLIAQTLGGAIDPQSSEFAQRRANLASQQLANQAALSSRALRGGLTAAGRAGGATLPIAQQQIGLQAAQADAAQRFNVFQQERDFTSRLLNELLMRNLQRGQVLGSLQFPGFQKASAFDKAAPLLSGVLGGAASVLGAHLGAPVTPGTGSIPDADPSLPVVTV